MHLYFGFNEEEEYVPPPELIEGLVSKDSLTFIYGHPGTGKSILAMGLAATLAEEEQAFFGGVFSPSIVIELPPSQRLMVSNSRSVWSTTSPAQLRSSMISVFSERESNIDAIYLELIVKIKLCNVRPGPNPKLRILFR